jgi:hypothetical protein
MHGDKLSHGFQPSHVCSYFKISLFVFGLINGKLLISTWFVVVDWQNKWTMRLRCESKF